MSETETTILNENAVENVEQNNTEQNTGKKKKLKFIDKFLITYIVFMIILFFTTRYVVNISNVNGSSMMPTYHNNQKLLSVCYYNNFKLNRGDVIIFYSKEIAVSERYIKRIVGVPGDTIQIIDKELYINGEKEVFSNYGIEPLETMEYIGVAEKEITLGDDEYFVLGDNRNKSNDSRLIGPVKSDHIICKVVFELTK